MQAIDILVNDHAKLYFLLSRMETTVDSSEKRLIFEDVRQFLSSYFFMEEAVFYPALVEVNELHDRLCNFYDQQQSVKDLLDKIETTTDTELVQGYFGEFQQLVKSFLVGEATDLLPAAQQVFSDAALRQLGLLMTDAKGSLDVAAYYD